MLIYFLVLYKKTQSFPLEKLCCVESRACFIDTSVEIKKRFWKETER